MWKPLFFLNLNMNHLEFVFSFCMIRLGNNKLALFGFYYNRYHQYYFNLSYNL